MLNEKELNAEEVNKVIETKDAEYIYNFATNVKGANIEKLENAIIETVTKNVEHIYEGEVEYIIYFAINVNGANIEKLENAIIELKNARDIYKFAIAVKGANIEKLENAIIETKNVEDICIFARDVKGANIEKLENAIIATNLVKFMQEFAKNVKGANIKKLENAIIEINNPSFISFMRKVLDDKEMTDSEIQMAKRKYISSLLDNIGEIDNGVMLGIYLGCLISPESTVEDLEKCNEAYLNYMSSREKEQTNNKKK